MHRTSRKIYNVSEYIIGFPNTNAVLPKLVPKSILDTYTTKSKKNETAPPNNGY